VDVAEPTGGTPERLHHAVQVFASEGALLAEAVPFLRSGLDRGEPAVVIATPAHIAAFEARLEDAGVETSDARQRGTLVMLDAQHTLSRFMVDGRPDADNFDAVVGELIRGLGANGRQPVAYGEMVALLWEAGDVVAALELEVLWNELLDREAFSLLCGYPTEVIGRSAVSVFHEMCSLHADLGDGDTAKPRHRGEPPIRHASRTFPCVSHAPGAARRFTSQTIERWGGDFLEEDALLVVSELASNAVLHAESDFVVTLSSDDRTLRVAVRDRSLALPQQRDRRPDADALSGGRGLLLTESFAHAWGTDTLGRDGKVVWAAFIRDPR
jgi:hypothetical protein